MVVSGHFYNGTMGEARRTDLNACGKPVHQLESDYQGRPDGGDGWLRYYTFDPAADEIDAFTYSPYLGTSETDADSQFVLSYDMSGTGPSGPPALARDEFARTASAGWASSDVGGAWTHAGSATRYTVAGGTGRQAVAAGSTLTSSLGPVGSTATDMEVTVALDRVPDATAYLTFGGRIVGSQDYSARLKVAPSGAFQLQLYRTGVAISGVVTPAFALTAGTRIHVRLQAEGTAPTSLRARVWRDGTTEPTAWQVVATDATAALQAAGGIRLSTYSSGTTTGGPLVSSFDDLLVAQIGTTPPPVNQPPQASFVATPHELSVAVDSAASSDPDGTIVSRAWTFGDGATAGTTTASHTYADAGTYTIGLTVTDDDGATATTNRQVTVSNPSSALAEDAFGRTLAAGWGTADVGGPWTVNSAARFSVGSGGGRIQVPSGSTLTAALPSVSSAATDLSATVSYAAQPDVSAYLSLSGRQVGAADYSARLKVLPTGSTQLGLLSGANVLTVGTLAAGTFVPGTPLHVRLQVQGTAPTTLRVRVWRDGTTEPSTWTMVATDAAAALQAPGAVRLTSYLSSGATTGPLALVYDDVRVVGIG